MQLHETWWRLVEYTPRVFLDTKTRYSQIENETLRDTFGLELFYDFVSGRKVLVKRDHQHLIVAAKKYVGDMPQRLQRFFLRLRRYDFEQKFVTEKNLVVPMSF